MGRNSRSLSARSRTCLHVWAFVSDIAFPPAIARRRTQLSAGLASNCFSIYGPVPASIIVPGRILNAHTAKCPGTTRSALTRYMRRSLVAGPTSFLNNLSIEGPHVCRHGSIPDPILSAQLNWPLTVYNTSCIGRRSSLLLETYAMSKPLCVLILSGLLGLPPQ